MPSLPNTLRGAAIVAAIVAALAALYLIFVRPDAALRRAAASDTAAIVADTQAQAAEDTVRIVVDHKNDVDRITYRTVETTHEILTAPGASDGIDPALHDAGLRALCLQDGRREPVCTRLLHADGGSVGSADADPSRPDAD